MSDKVSIRGIDPEGVADGDYVVTVSGGHITGLTAASGGGGPLAVDDEGVETVAVASRLNFTGAGVAVTDAGFGEATIDIPGGGGSGVVESVVAGAGIAVDSTDPANPVVSATGGGGGLGARPISLPQGTLTRAYRFDATSEGWTADSGTVGWDSAGRLKHTIGATGSSQFILEPSSAANVTDGEFCIDLTDTNGAGGTMDITGIAFRATDHNNLYYATFRSVSGGGAYAEIYKRVGGSITTLSASSIGVGVVRRPVSGVTNIRMMVRFVGAHIRFYLDETLVGAVNDTTLTTGRCGVRHFSNSSSQVSLWDDALVYTLPSTWRPPAYD